MKGFDVLMKTIIEVEDCDKGILKDMKGNYYYCEGCYKEVCIDNKKTRQRIE